MNKAECPFSFRVSLVATHKAFKQQSFADGVKQIGLQVNNLLSRSQEIVQPESAAFSTLIERRVNPITGMEDLYWQGYKRSIDDSMRRFIAYLKVTGASEAKIEQAKAERRQWQKIRQVTLALDDGQAIQWLALRDTDPQAGVAWQQLVMVDGQLVLQSRLLPFKDVNQINWFVDLVGTDRRSLEIDIDNTDGLSPLLTWAVQGKALDFKQELPELINRAGREQPIEAKELIRDFGVAGPVRVENYPVAVWESVSGAETIQLNPAKQNTEIIKTDFKEEEKEKEDRVIVSGFWFEVIRGRLLTTQTLVSSRAEEKAGIAQKNQVVLPTTEVSFVEQPSISNFLDENPAKEEIFESKKEPVVKGGVLFQAMTVGNQDSKQASIKLELKIESKEKLRIDLGKSLTAVKVPETAHQISEAIASEISKEASWGVSQPPAETIFEPAPKKVVSESQDKSLILPMTKTMVESEQEKITVSQVNRDETLLPIWEIKMQGISLDDIPEWNLSSVLIGEDLGWSMTVPGLKAEEKLETNAERAFKLGKWSEFDYLKKTAEVVETILLVIVNTNWEQPPLLRRKIIKDFGGDWGSGSVKYRQIQR